MKESVLSVKEQTTPYKYSYF